MPLALNIIHALLVHMSKVNHSDFSATSINVCSYSSSNCGSGKLKSFKVIAPLETTTIRYSDAAKDYRVNKAKYYGVIKRSIKEPKPNLETTSINNLSLPTSTPKKPCSHCGQQHWSWTCPMRSEEEKLQDAVNYSIRRGAPKKQNGMPELNFGNLTPKQLSSRTLLPFGHRISDHRRAPSEWAISLS